MPQQSHNASVGNIPIPEQGERIQKSALVGSLMSSISGLVAVLSDQRQVIAANQALLDAIGIHDPTQLAGLQPGKVLGCIHADEPGSLCSSIKGKAEYCPTCGVASAIASAFSKGTACEQYSTFQIKRDGKTTDLFFQARCVPVVVEGQRYYLLCLEDKTASQRSAALERTFFHDINSLIASLTPPVKESQSLGLTKWTSESFSVPVALDRQKALHRYMADEADYDPVVEPTSAGVIIDQLRRRLASHPQAQGKTIELVADWSDFEFSTDSTVLLEILMALTTNALEATRRGGQIRISANRDGNEVTFGLWNKGKIRPHIAPRIFQPNFSTKAEFGRGIGTYIARRLTVELLHGQASFITSDSGTVFELTLPCSPEAYARPAAG